MVSARVHPGSRFNVLLAEDREHSVEHWFHQLPRLLEPQGVRSFVARTGNEAMQIVESVQIHAAVIDLDTPPGAPTRRPAPGSKTAGAAGRAAGINPGGGLWLLDVLRRASHRPPVVVVNDVRLPPAQVQRLLNEALRLGAFSVVDRPNDLHDLLVVLRRLLDRAYQGQWPVPGDPSTDQPDGGPSRRS